MRIPRLLKNSEDKIYDWGIIITSNKIFVTFRKRKLKFVEPEYLSVCIIFKKYKLWNIDFVQVERTNESNEINCIMGEKLRDHKINNISTHVLLDWTCEKRRLLKKNRNYTDTYASNQEEIVENSLFRSRFLFGGHIQKYLKHQLYIIAFSDQWLKNGF